MNFYSLSTRAVNAIFSLGHTAIHRSIENNQIREDVAYYLYKQLLEQNVADELYMSTTDYSWS